MQIRVPDNDVFGLDGKEKGHEVDSRETRCKNDSNVKGGVEAPGTGLGMGWMCTCEMKGASS